MAKKTEYIYKWSEMTATVNKHPRRNEWNWDVSDDNTDYEATNFNSHIDSELLTAKEAENDMINEIKTRLGHAPKTQIP